MDVVKRILRYLKVILRDVLVYHKSEDIADGHHIFTYTDVEWVVDLYERRSVFRFCIFIGQNIASWSSRKQKVIARSSI